MIISFYSYKGGVGRSQLCANIAAYFCYKMGKKVLLWDWDFEAPGLHYFFGKKNRDITSEGTIEMLYNYVKLMRSNPAVEEKDIEFLPNESFIHLIDGETVKGKKGKIDLLPGGNYNERFVNKVNSFNWFEFYELLDGITYIEKVKKWIKSLGYDYVLIDSRTGINDYSGICNIQLPDVNIVVTAANEQNIAGSKRIINQILNSDYTKEGFRKPYILPVLSRIDMGHPKFEYWLSEFVNAFSYLLDKFNSKIDPIFTEEIFRDFYLTKTCLEYVPIYSAGENLLIDSFKQTIIPSSFISKYSNIGEYLDNLNESGGIGIFNQISKDSWTEFAERAEIENNSKKASVAYSYAGNYDKSIELGGTYQAFFHKGNDFLRNRKFDNAIECFQKTIEIKPDHFEAISLVGLSYISKKETDTAIEYFQKTIEFNPNHYKAFYYLGFIYADEGKFDEAIEYYQKAIEIKPDFTEALYHLGIAYADKNDYNKTIECYQKAIEIEPNNFEILNNLGNAYANKNEFGKAIEYYQKAIENKSDYHEALFNLGIVYADKNEFDKAIECYQKAIEIAPKNHNLWNSLGFSFMQSGDLSSAHSAFSNAIKFGNVDFGNMNLGHVYLVQGKEKNAISCYEKSLAAFVNKTEFWQGMKTDLQNLGKYGIIVKYFNNILEKLKKSKSDTERSEVNDEAE